MRRYLLNSPVGSNSKKQQIDLSSLFILSSHSISLREDCQKSLSNPLRVQRSFSVRPQTIICYMVCGATLPVVVRNNPNLKPKGDVTRNLKQGYQRPHKKDSCPPKIFKKKEKRITEINADIEVVHSYVGSN